MTSPLKLALLGSAAAVVPAAPAAAQHAGHSNQPAASTSAQSACLPEHAAMGHCTPAPVQPVQRQQPGAGTRPASTSAAQSACPPEHAAMGHCTPAPQPQPTLPPQQQASGAAPARSTPPQATCAPEHAAMGHCTPAAPTTVQAAPARTTPAAPAAATGQTACPPEHAEMGHCTPSPAQGSGQSSAALEGTNLPAGNAPPPPVPTANAADAFYGRAAMDMGRHHLEEFHGDQKFFQVLNNIAEYRAGKGADGYGWESEAWYGGDINRFWLKTEGEGAFGEGIESAEVQALYSHAIDPYWNVQGGLRYDFKPNPSRVYATVQLEGLAPSFFDVEGALFLSNKGELSARVGGYYDQRITQRLILQPRVEFDFAAQNSREIGVGAGLSKAEFGARLRYDIRREFAPYIGVQYERAFGRTASYRRAEGEKAGALQLLIGVRTWF
jgi:copper resistance protein B